MINQTHKIAVLVFLLLFSCGLAFAKEFIPGGPLVSRTQNPVYLQTLGQIPSRAATLEKRQLKTWLDMSYSNIFDWGRRFDGTELDDEVLLDMELARLAINLDFGIGNNMEAGLQIPFLHFNGGYFDAFIQGFHNAFGFPNAGRSQFPDGAFNYRITKDGNEIYRVRRQPFGLSDIIAGFKHNILPETGKVPGVAWTFRFKFPTGNPAAGMGSGNPDFSFGCNIEKSIRRWHFYANLDYIVGTGNRYIADLSQSQQFAWLTAAGFSVSQPVSLLIQIQGSTPLLRGMGLEKWDGYPLDIVAGVKGVHKKLIWGNDLFWQWSFSEDLTSEGPSSDITTMLVIGVTFGAF